MIERTETTTSPAGDLVSAATRFAVAAAEAASVSLAFASAVDVLAILARTGLVLEVDRPGRHLAVDALAAIADDVRDHDRTRPDEPRRQPTTWIAPAGFHDDEVSRS